MSRAPSRSVSVRRVEESDRVCRDAVGRAEAGAGGCGSTVCRGTETRARRSNSCKPLCLGMLRSRWRRSVFPQNPLLDYMVSDGSDTLTMRSPFDTLAKAAEVTIGWRCWRRSNHRARSGTLTHLARRPTSLAPAVVHPHSRAAAALRSRAARNSSTFSTAFPIIGKFK